MLQTFSRTLAADLLLIAPRFHVLMEYSLHQVPLPEQAEHSTFSSLMSPLPSLSYLTEVPVPWQTAQRTTCTRLESQVGREDEEWFRSGVAKPPT